MKTLMFVLVILILAQLPTFAQSFQDDALSVEFVTLARNVDVRTSFSSNTLTKDNLAYGFRIGYEHCLGRKNGRGDFCIGVDGGGTFHSVGQSKLALVRGQYFAKWQANGAKKFQPFVKGTLGMACDHFTKKTGNTVTNTGCPAFTFGGGVGADIPIKEGSRTKWRIAGEYFTTNFRVGFERQRQHNFEISTGIVF